MAFWNSTGYTITTVNIGNRANDGTGDDIRTAFLKVDNDLGNISSFLSSTSIDFLNANIATQLNATLGNVGNLTVGNLVGSQNVYGNITTYGNIIPGAGGVYNLGSAAAPFANLYVQNTVSTTQISQSTTAGILQIHANINPGDVQDVGILGNVTNNFNGSNNYAFFGHQYATNNFIYKITPLNTAVTGGNNIITGGFYGNTQFGSQFLSNTTDATSTTTGALQVAGGAGIGANLYVGNNVVATGNVYSNGSQVVTLGTAGIGPQFSGGTINGQTSFISATPSTSTSTGAVVISNGGLGVSGNLVATAVYGQLHGTINPDSASQPFITSLGTLTGLTMASGSTISANILQATTIGVTTLNVGTTAITSGAITGLNGLTLTGTLIAATVQAATIGNSGATLTGTLSTASQTNITAVGTLGSLAVTNGVTAANLVLSGNVIANTVSAATIGNTGAIHYGNLSSTTQANITAIGTLTGLTVSGAVVPSANLTINLGSPTAYFGTVYAGQHTGNTVSVGSGGLQPLANAAINIGSTTAWFNNIYGTAIHAQYADLAENYLTDQEYEPGTVVVVGGAAEVTACSEHGQDSVIGAISTNPAYLMNGAAGGQAVALKGRVPLRVYGPIQKGQRLSTSHEAGHAEYAAGAYSFAIALETDIGLGAKIIEAIIL